MGSVAAVPSRTSLQEGVRATGLGHLLNFEVRDLLCLLLDVTQWGHTGLGMELQGGAHTHTHTRARPCPGFSEHPSRNRLVKDVHLPRCKGHASMCLIDC